MKRTIQCSTVMHKLYAGKSVRVLFVSGLSALMLAGIMPPSARAELPGKSMSVAQAAKKVTGTVLDEQGQPMIGVTVRLRDGKAGATTDLDGKFSIEVPQNSVLVFSYIGYQEYTLTVGNQNNYIINMESENAALDEVVVIGYQTIKRKDLTGSVASVRGEDVATMPVANVAQALQGKLPGVNVTTQDGRPDATVSIRVRGGGSISQSNDPLILVDGITVKSLDDIPSDQVESIDVLKDASSTAIYGARGANGVILVTTKGAKEGKVSVSYNGYVKFNTPTKYLDTLDPYDYLSFVWGNAAALGDAYRVSFEKLYGLGDNAGSNTGGIESYRNVSNQDIQKDVYNSSVSHNHDLTITGGNDKTRMLFSANYMDEEGMKINSYARRASFNFKINQKITKNLDVSFDARYSDRRTMGDEKTTNGSGSILSSSYRFRPIATSDILGDLDAMREGNMEMYGRQSTWDRYSPAARIGDYEPLYIKQRLRGTASLNWRIIDGLTYHTDLSYNRTWEEDKIWGGAIYNNYMNDATGEKLYAGSVEWAKRGSWGLRWTNTMSYDFNFLPEEHRLNLLLGHEVTDSGGDEIEIDANHFPANFTKDNAFAMINQYDKTAGTSNFFSGVDMPERILSFFGRVNYTLLDRYLFTFTFRADGSSKFSPEHRWGYFPAAAIGWRISEEPFMESTRDWLDNLKLRFSYGSVGNDGIDANLWSQMWTSETDMRWQYALNNQYSSSYDYSATEMANRDLKWETTITRNIGVDFSFFNSRLWGSVDLYWNTTKDLLMLTSIPGITGFTATYDNIGQTSNKGIEISLSGEIYKDKDWNITAGMNINFNKGNVDELADNVTGLYSSSWCGSSSFPGNDYILKEGSPVGIVRGYIYDGFYTTDDFNYVNGQYILKEGVADLGSFINPVHGVDRPEGQNAYPGLPKYRDMNDDKVIDELDVCEIGDMNPVHTGGFNINATWKNFDLGLYFNWSYGNDVYNVNKIASMYCAKESGAYENKLAFMKDAYKIYDIVDGQLVHLTTPEQLNAANVNAKYPLPYSENGVTSTLAIEDGSYLRLNTLTLGYSLPQNLLRKVGISKLRIYGTVYNVFTITGYSGLDPEVSANTSNNNATYPTVGLDWGTYPRARSFVVGLNLTF
ncbi:TonB-dependent receptor [Marseilla massiliensis]|uniref:TonB-dependent receptor n=2 Tax=Marseilla massiliensis TaxID=1841864 RepID=A0A938WS94_9BACT|nr:TonB-dependent receptor [Marseilla massiliensis]